MKILLFGKDGQVGWELQRSLAPLGGLIACDMHEANFEELDGLRACIHTHQPDVIVNAAAYTDVDKAESDAVRARRINADAVGVLAEEASRLGAWLVHYSTDYVFDGKGTSAYTEDAPTGPLSVYGTTKLEGEQHIRRSHARHLIFRTSWIFSARGNNFAKTMLRLATEREELHVIDDQFGAPTSAELIADVTALVLHRVRTDGDTANAGTYNLAAGGCTTWHEYAQYVLQLAKQKGMALKAGPAQVKPITTDAYPLAARRPRNSRLNTVRLATTFQLCLPDWRYHVRRLVDELTTHGQT